MGLGIGEGIGSIIGGLVGNSRASGDQQAANEAAMAAYKQLQSIGLPPDMARQVILEKYKSAGTLTPELEKAINLGPSAVSGIQEDGSLRNAQMQALQQMQQAGQTGFTAQDQLNNQRMQNSVNADNQSRQASILQGAQQRGESGSGAALAAQLLASQGGSNNESEQGLQLAAQGNNARMQALSQAAGLGGQLRAQDFGVNQAKASAADQFQRFNVQNQQQVANQNVSANNQAQAANLSNNQNIANANTGNANQEALRQNQGRLQNFQNDMQRNQVIANGLLGQASQLNGQADATRKQASQFGQGLGGIAEQGIGMAMGVPSSGAKPKAMAGDPSASSYGDIGAIAAHGGMIQHFDNGGMVEHYASGGITKGSEDDEVNHYHFGNASNFDANTAGPRETKDFNDYIRSRGYADGGQVDRTRSAAAGTVKGANGADITNPSSWWADGGMQDSMQMPQQIPMQQMPQNGMINASNGMIVPGHSPFKGDNYGNDKVHAMLSPGEIIIPRSITSREDAPERAKEFIKGILASKKMGR